MAQAAPQTAHYDPIERPCGQYTIQEQGHSLTVTVPERMDLAAETTVSIRKGLYHGRVIYLKAIPLEAAFTGHPGTRPVTTTVEGERITEDEVGVYIVRDGTNKMLTVPAECGTDRFAEQTEPMLVTGTADERFMYLKIIPECLYEASWSIATDDLVRIEQPKNM
jgi:hypothetical protein